MPPPQIIGRPSEVEPLLERAGQRAAEVERAALKTSSSSPHSSWQKQKLIQKALPRRRRLRRQGPKRQLRRKRAEELWRCWEREPWRRQGQSVLRQAAWRSRAQARRWWARPGPSKPG